MHLKCFCRLVSVKNLLVIRPVNTFPSLSSQSIMINPAFFFGSKTKPALLLASHTANELIAMKSSFPTAAC